jgi:hypothetical protein
MGKLDEMAASIKKLSDITLPEIEDQLYQIESRIKKSIKKKRNDIRKDCLETIRKNELNLNKLKDLHDKIKS